MKDAAELINALAGLAWPLIAGIVLWRLFPTIKAIAGKRGFTVRVGDAELTVQEISEQFLASTAEIQGTLASVTSAEDMTTSPERITREKMVRRILWVDDNPSNNAYLIAQFESLGVEVRQARSTDAGVAAVLDASEPFDVVVSDMGRQEPAGYRDEAGLELIRELRNQRSEVPILIFATRHAVAMADRIVDAGGNGVTNSGTQLFALLRQFGRFPGKPDA